MSGYCVLCLPNPDLPSFQNLFGVIGIFLCVYSIVWCLLFYFKSPNKFQQNSSFYHLQSYRSIINQQSLPEYLLDAFNSHWDLCALPHLLQDHDSHQSPSNILLAIAYLHLFQRSPSYPCVLEWLFTLHMSPILSMILVPWLASLHSSLTSLTTSNVAFTSVLFQRSMK